MQTYVVASQRNLQAARNRQFAECMKEGRPFITVGNKRRFSSVELDMFTTRFNLDDAAQLNLAGFLRTHSERDARVSASKLVCRSTKVKAQIAEQVAAGLYLILEREVKRMEREGGRE